MHRRLIAVGGILGLLAVVLGAFGTHSLREKISDQAMATWQTGVQYHLAHALAILLVATLSASLPRIHISGWLFAGGVVVFSGTLYLYAVTGTKAFAMVTPLGGVLFLGGWIWLVYSALKGT